MFTDSIRSWLIYCLSVVVVIIMFALVTSVLSRVDVAPVQLADYNSYQCQTGNAASTREFHILTLTPLNARQIADGLCSETAQLPVASVKISWFARSHLTARDIVAGNYDLFWNRLHLVEGMVPSYADYYRIIFDTPTYPLYWVALNNTPHPGADYFATHVVGFLDDPKSQTMFLQPHDWLREHNIELGKNNARFYPSIESLRVALLQGEIDVMSMSPNMIGLLGLEAHKKLLINANVESGSWFLHQRWLQSGIPCKINNVLQVQNDLLDAPESSQLPGKVNLCPIMH